MSAEFPDLTSEQEKTIRRYLRNKCNKEGHPEDEDNRQTWTMRLDGDSVIETLYCKRCKQMYEERMGEDYAKELKTTLLRNRAGGQVSGIPLQYRLGTSGWKCVDSETRDAEEWFKDHAYEFFNFCEKLKVERYFRKRRD